MADPETNQEKLQECAKMMSRLIQLEHVFRVGQISVDGEEHEFPAAFKNLLKTKFSTVRSEMVTMLNSITAE